MRKIMLSVFVIFLSFSCHINTETSGEEFQTVSVSQPDNPGEIQDGMPELKLIKEANLRFATEDLAKTRDRILQIIQHRKAYMSGETSFSTSYDLTEKISVKVPSLLFDSLISDVVKEVESFDAKDIRVKDVTNEYIDLQARINNEKILEQRYLTLLARAGTIDEILKIERKVAEVREGIERAEGRLIFLNRKVKYSQIEIEYYKVNNVEPSFSADISGSFLNGWNYLKGLVIGIANIWPFLILFIAGWLLVRERKVFRFKKGKMAN